MNNGVLFANYDYQRNDMMVTTKTILISNYEVIGAVYICYTYTLGCM